MVRMQRSTDITVMMSKQIRIGPTSVDEGLYQSTVSKPHTTDKLSCTTTKFSTAQLSNLCFTALITEHYTKKASKLQNILTARYLPVSWILH